MLHNASLIACPTLAAPTAGFAEDGTGIYPGSGILTGKAAIPMVFVKQADASWKAAADTRNSDWAS